MSACLVMDAGLRALVRRLKVAELDHLREHCNELAEHIEALEAENADLRQRLSWAEDCADRWRDDALEAINRADCGVGLTVSGHIVALPRKGAAA